MTVIVFDGETMAADSGMLIGNVVDVTPGRKIVRLPDGRLVGASGTCGDCHAAMDWFLAGEPAERPVFFGKPEDRLDVDILVAKPDGTLWRNAIGLSNWFRVPLLFTIGDRDAALVAQTALHLGRSAAEAVQVAVEMCASIIGPVQTERLRAEPPLRLAAGSDCMGA